MSDLEFETLLDERAQLRLEHEAWCDEVNGPFGSGENSYAARRRDATYARLTEVEAQIDAACEEDPSR